MKALKFVPLAIALTLVATLYQPGQASGVDCPAVIYGDFAEDDLLASRVGSATHTLQ